MTGPRPSRGSANGSSRLCGVLATILVVAITAPFASGCSAGAPSPIPATVGHWDRFDGGPLTTRTQSLVAWAGKEILVTGGRDVANRPLGDGAAYDPAAGRWRPIAPRPDPGRVP